MKTFSSEQVVRVSAHVTVFSSVQNVYVSFCTCVKWHERIIKQDSGGKFREQNH